MFFNYLRQDKTTEELFAQAQQNNLSIINFNSELETTTIPELGVVIATIPATLRDYNCDLGVCHCGQYSDECGRFLDFDFYKDVGTKKLINKECRSKFQSVKPVSARCFSCNLSYQ